MKVDICRSVPEGFQPTGELTIFSPIDDPGICVLCHRYEERSLIVRPTRPRSVWVAVPSERVEKIRFVLPEQMKAPLEKVIPFQPLKKV